MIKYLVARGMRNGWLGVRSVVFRNILDSIGNVFDVLGGEAGHGDTAVLRHINMMLFHHSVTLRWRQTREREHADLLGDVAPRALGSVFLQGGSQQIPHFSNTVSDGDQLVEPLLSQVWRVQDHGSDSGTVAWW